MLNVLRHKGVAKKVLWAVTVIIILSFAIFGSAYRLDNQINSAGTMYGKAVNIRDFQQAYFDARDQAIILYGDEYFKNGQNLNLEQQAWDRLILQREITKQNIKVSDQEVVNFIAELPFFQDNGKFDQFKYRMIVSDPRVFDRRNTRDFEEGIRRNLMVKKLFEIITGPNIVTEDVLKREYVLRHEKITLDYALVDPNAFTKDINVSAEEINAYFLKNKESFRKPPMIKLDYVQIVLPEKATDAQKEEAKKQIYNLSAQLTASSDFAAQAKKFNLDVKQSDYFTLEQPILTFASSPEETEKMFAMKKGEFSKPLNVPDGWQIVRINDKKESLVPNMDDIKDDVKAAVINDRAFQLARAKAETSLPKLLEAVKAMDFKAAATSVGLKVEQTPSFSRGEYIANVGIVQQFQQDAMKLTKEKPVSGIINTSEGPAIIHLAKAEPVDDKQYIEEKEEFKQMLEAQQRQQKIGMFLNQLRLAANVKSKVKQR